MKIVFYSNIMNHHQLPLSLELQRLTNDNYTFVATMPFEEANVAKGYENLNEKYDFILCTYKSDENKKLALQLAREAEIVIIGSAPKEYLCERIKSKKLVFRYMERPFRRAIPWYMRLYQVLSLYMEFVPNNGKYLLCAGAYTVADFYRIGLKRIVFYKWGYFPATKQIEDIDNLINRKEKKRILWCGRFLEWKHPDKVILIADRLRREGLEFEISFIGNGPMEKTLMQMVLDYNLMDYVSFWGSMSPDDVRLKMESSGVYLFTSDKNEGWGAVLNEAMNSGCAVVASNEIGSVPYLVRNGVNGLVYKSDDINDLYNKVKQLLIDTKLQETLGRAAYLTIKDKWNAEIAASRLFELSKALLDGKLNDRQYVDGPCSIAEIIKC